MTTLPESLIRYEHQLDTAVRADFAARRRRRLAIRATLACAAVAAVALGALSVFDHAASVVRPASAESVVRRSIAALAGKPKTILHVQMLGFQDNGDGTTIRWSDESWQEESPPYARRSIQIAPGGSRVESTSDARSEQVYDSARNTIYVAPSSPDYTPAELNRLHLQPGPRPGMYLQPGPRPGTYVLRVSAARGAPTLVISARQAKALHARKLDVAWKVSKHDGHIVSSLALIPHPKIINSSPSPGPSPDPWSPAFRNQILALLKSGGAHVVGHKTIAGRDTIEISSTDGHTFYYVDPKSYRPVALGTRGTDGGTLLRLHVYEQLPVEGNGNLLSLTAQHPTARVDRNPADYQAAQARLFPHG